MNRSFRPIDTHNSHTKPPPPPTHTHTHKSVRHGNERANSGCYAHVLAGTVLEDAALLDSDVASLINWLPTFQYDVVAFYSCEETIKKARHFVYWISCHKCCLETSMRRQSPEQNPQLYRSENLKNRMQNGCVLTVPLLGSVDQQSSEKLSVSRRIYTKHMTIFWKYHKSYHHLCKIRVFLCTQSTDLLTSSFP